MKFRTLEDPHQVERENAGWFRDFLVLLGACLVGNVAGAVASGYVASCLADGIVKREGPIGFFCLSFLVCCFVCRFCGGFVGPLVTHLVPTRGPQPAARAVISLGSGIAWVFLFLNPWSPFNQ